MKSALQVVGAVVLVIVLTVAIMMWGFGVEMFGLRLGKHVENAKTEVLRETNQYRTTQETGLAAKMQAWYDADAEAARLKDDPEAVATIRAQQAAIIRDMNRTVNSGTITEVPEDVANFLATH